MHVCPRCGFREALSVAEAAEKLGVSGQTIRNWIKAGKLVGVETEVVPGSAYRYWIPVDVIESPEIVELAAMSSSQGKLAKEGRARAATVAAPGTRAANTRRKMVGRIGEEILTK